MGRVSDLAGRQKPSLDHRLRSRPTGPNGTDRRLRVCIVTESFLPSVNGVTNSVLRIVEQLSAAGHVCLVVAPGPGAETLAGAEVIRVRSFELPKYGDLRVGLPTARLTQIIKRFKPDVVHLAAPALLGAAAAVAAKRLGIPTVAVYQTDLAGFASRHHLGLARRPIWNWISWVHRCADLTLAPSSAAMWTLRRHGVEEVALWGRGVDLDRFSPRHRDPGVRQALLSGSPGDVLVGYVGRLAPEKQVGRLAAVSRLPDVRLIIVGDGPDRSALERRLPKAAFLGLCHGAELGAIYAALDVFVHTGLDETFCQSVQEALASGVPVVAPASGGPIDLVRHGRNGYLWNPAAPESLVGAVGDLVQSPVLRRRFGLAARASVLERPWSALAHELVEHYHSVMLAPTTARRPLRTRQRVAS